MRQLKTILSQLIFPVIVLTLMLSMLYLFTQRSMFFPSTISYKITIGKLSFQSCMWYILCLSIVRCYYFREFTFLSIIESKFIYYDVEKSVRHQLFEVEKAFFSMHKFKILIGKLERFNVRLCSVMKYVITSLRLFSTDVTNDEIIVANQKEEVPDTAYVSDHEQKPSKSDVDLAVMMFRIRQHCNDNILINNLKCLSPCDKSGKADECYDSRTDNHLEFNGIEDLTLPINVRSPVHDVVDTTYAQLNARFLELVGPSMFNQNDNEVTNEEASLELCRTKSRPKMEIKKRRSIINRINCLPIKELDETEQSEDDEDDYKENSRHRGITNFNMDLMTYDNTI